MFKNSLVLLGLAVMSFLPVHAQQIRFTPQWTPQSQFAGYYAAVENGYYAEAGLDVVIETEQGEMVQTIPQVDLLALKVDIKVDALPSTATHSAIKDSQLRSLLENGIISFEEYVSALADDSTMPVEAFKKIVEGRQQMAQIQQLVQTQQAQIAQYQQILGGYSNEMQTV
jgi:hypothetical protein